MNKKTDFTESQIAILKETEQYVSGLLSNESTGHDWHHIERVRSMARFLAQSEKGDSFIIEMAALLHDVDDPKITQSGDSHRVQDFLSRLGLDPATQDTINEIIDSLSFSSNLQGKKETRIEGKIVQDADRLDALGAIGIARTFAYGGRKNRLIYDGSTDDQSSVAHFYQKLFLLKDLMNTNTASKIATERTLFMRQYMEQFLKEWNLSIDLNKEVSK